MTSNYSIAQYCTKDNRFTNAEFFSGTQYDSLTNVTYGNAINHDGESEDLKIDFYYPSDSKDGLSKRPFILLIHGGGFTHGKKEHMTYQCQEFAKRGFVTATMSYRLGYNRDMLADAANAVYRAHQDASAALRYVIEHAERLRIDPSWIFMGGTSAGAITSLYTTYASQEEWNQAIPQIESRLGPLYSSGNKLKHTYKIRGIYNNQGAVAPVTLSPEDLIPMISFHGELDQVVPIDQGYTGLGSRAIHNMLSDAGVCNDFTIVPTGRHGVFMNPEGADFRIDRVTCFFKSLFCDTCTNFLSSATVQANCSN